MENRITVREAVTEIEIAAFWEQLYNYYKRDIFPDSVDGEQNHFLGVEYRQHMEIIHKRPQDRCYYLLFYQNEQNVGFAMPVIYTSEDGKCFIMDFCVYPEFRGNSMGKECARALLKWAEKNGAFYAELNYSDNVRRKHFWQSIGFVQNGSDQWGDPLMLFPPKERAPISVEILTDSEDWQLQKLENGFRAEVGVPALTEEMYSKLTAAIQNGETTFFLAKRGYRAVGMCSITRYFSSSICSEAGILSDLYVEPVFRKKGIAQMLCIAAMDFCKENNIVNPSVFCSSKEEKLFQNLNFNNTLDILLIHSN